jgi:LEA14-like dessication related protein
MRTIVLSLAAGAVLALAACASGGGSSNHVRYYRPTVSLDDVRMAGMGVLGGTMDVTIGVHNPNDFPLHTPRVRYRLLVDTLQIASGSYDSDAVVGADDSLRVMLPVPFSYMSLTGTARTIMNRGTMEYRMVGDITVWTRHGRFTTPFSRAGRFAPMTMGMSR